jgi:hypothetical protein
MHSSVLHVGWSVRFAAIREQLILTAMNGLKISELRLRIQPPYTYILSLYDSVSIVNNIFTLYRSLLLFSHAFTYFGHFSIIYSLLPPILVFAHYR